MGDVYSDEVARLERRSERLAAAWTRLSTVVSPPSSRLHWHDLASTLSEDLAETLVVVIAMERFAVVSAQVGDGSV